MQVTVNTTPQAIFPFGEQDALVIRNNGPSTIFVDSDSAVNQGGHAVPPTGVLAWDAERPLWMVASDVSEGTASVTITRNAQAANFSNYLDTVLYETITDKTQLTPLIEVSAFKFITIMMKNPALQITAGSGVNIGDYFICGVYWYDNAGNHLGQEETVCYPACSGDIGDDGGYVRVVLPVKGAYVALFPSDQTGVPTTLRVVGSTRDVRIGQAFGAEDPFIYNPFAGGPVNYFNGARSCSLFLDNTVAWTLWVPNLGNRLKFVVDTVQNTASTVAGQVGFRDVRDGNIFLASLINIPVGGTYRNEYDLVLPLYTPIAMTVTLPTPIANLAAAYFHLTWYD